MKKAVLLSGERGAGKTTLCVHLAEALPDVGGIVCPAIFNSEGNKTGIRCVSLNSGESWELAGVKPEFFAAGADCGGRADGEAPADGRGLTGNPEGLAENVSENRYVQIGKYRFSEVGIQRGLKCILRSLRRRTGITIIDEIGPLEFQGGGFAPAMQLLREAGDLLIVVRPSLLKAVSAYVSDHQLQTFNLTLDNRMSLRQEVQRFFVESG